ncbi:MAG TPA: hypothetical protein VHK24_06950, partial [Steroidobacter sp.]|nr:hypothetical protein [Steroidobacter sp.]
MAVPWLQIVQLVPSIVEVSRELLKQTKRAAPQARTVHGAEPSGDELLARVAALEENERRQAELVSQMADQLAAISKAVTALHRRAIWLSAACGAALADIAKWWDPEHTYSGDARNLTLDTQVRGCFCEKLGLYAAIEHAT